MVYFFKKMAFCLRAFHLSLKLLVLSSLSQHLCNHFSAFIIEEWKSSRLADDRNRN